MSEATLAQLEETIRSNKKIVALNDALERLKSNRDFKTVIMDGYFKEEAIRLVVLRADPAHQSDEQQAAIMKQIDAIGGVMSYFHTCAHLAKQAEKAVADDEATVEEINMETQS